MSTKSSGAERVLLPTSDKTHTDRVSPKKQKSSFRR